MRWSLAYIAIALTATLCFAQPVERPPRPGETIERQPKGNKLAVDHRRYRKVDKLRPAFGVTAGAFIVPKGTFAALSAGVRFGAFGIGAEFGYADYERSFVGSKTSFVSPGDSSVTERGSFFRPAIYGEYEIVSGTVSIVPRFTLGYANIVSRRCYSSSPDDSRRFERERLINTWELNILFPIGPLTATGSLQWWVDNPWFFVYPEDFGLLAAGMTIGF